MNIVMNDAGHFIEVQGTAEGHAFTDDELSAMLGLARAGIADIITAQYEAIAAAGRWGIDGLTLFRHSVSIRTSGPRQRALVGPDSVSHGRTPGSVKARTIGL